jgi:hypothetical protein
MVFVSILSHGIFDYTMNSKRNESVLIIRKFWNCVDVGDGCEYAKE